MRIAITDAPDRQELERWDRLVSETAGTDVSQLSAWARVRGSLGFRAQYVFATEDDELVAGAQVLYRRAPFVGGLVGYIPYGPVISPSAACRRSVCAAIAEGCMQLLDRRSGGLFIQPPDDAHDVTTQLLGIGFRRSDVDIAPRRSLRLDLGQTEEALRARLGRRLRYWTNRWPSRGVTVRVGDLDDVRLLVRLMDLTGRQHGFRPLPAHYVESMFRELSPSGRAVLFVGEVDGRPVAADLLTRSGGVIRGRLSGFDRSGEAGRLSVPGAIRWEAIRWARARGDRWFDFGGISEVTLHDLTTGHPERAERWPGPDRAKVSFGGTPYEYPAAVELITPPILRRGFDVVTSRGGSRAIGAVARTVRSRGRRGGGAGQAVEE